MCSLLDALWHLESWMHYAKRDVKYMGQQMEYRSLEWNWPKEAINIPIGAGITDDRYNIIGLHPDPGQNRSPQGHASRGCSPVHTSLYRRAKL